MLPGDRDADVCIVGAGYTGLWTAYYLKRADPALRIVVLEARFAGFGASGRNGGWLSGLVPGDRDRMAAQYGADRVLAWQRALNDAVDEVIDVAAGEGIDAGIVKGGTLEVARNRASTVGRIGIPAGCRCGPRHACRCAVSGLIAHAPPHRLGVRHALTKHVELRRDECLVSRRIASAPT